MHEPSSPTLVSGGMMRNPERKDHSDIAVLLVEDDDQDARLLDALLADSDWDLRVRMSRASSLEEARLQLDVDRCDVVLLDLGLPDSQGLDTYHVFAESHPALPVVVLSGQDDKDCALSAVRRGAQDYLVKGQVTGENLLRVLHYAVERSEVLKARSRDGERQRLLLEVGRVALEGTGDDHQRLLDEAAPALARGLGVARTHILQCTPAGLRFRAGAGWDQPDRLGSVVVEAGAGSWAGFAVQEGRPIAVDDLSTESRFQLGALLEMEPPTSGLVVPIQIDSTWGVLGAFSDEPSAFSDEEVFFARQLAGLLGSAFARWEVEHQRAERVKELTAMRAVSRAVQRDLTVYDLAASVADALVSAVQFPESTVARVRLNGDWVTRPHGAREPEGAVLGADIVVDGKRRGRLEFGYTSELPFLPEEQELLESIAETVSVWMSRREAHAELADSRRRLQMVLSQLPAIVYTVDRDLKLTSIAGQQADVLIELAGDPIGTPIEQLVGGLSRSAQAEVTTTHEAALAGEPGDYTLESDGRVWVGSTEPLVDAEGQVIGAVGLAMDDTERRRQQQALAASRARLQALFDHALDAILLADDDGRYLDANPAACQLTGYSRDELLTMGVADLTVNTPEGFEASWDTFQGDGQDSGRVALRRRDGQVVVVEYRAAAGIQPGVHLSIMRDVTARLRAERALRGSERRFRELAEHSSDGIYRLRLAPDKGFEYVNPALEAITGYAREEIETDLWLLHRQTHVADRLDRSRPMQEPTEHRFQRRDGSWIWIELQEVLIDDEEGKTTAVHGLVRDVTDRRERRRALEEALRQESEWVERLRRLDAMREGFLQAVSHEFRTPLTTIYGNAVTLREHQANLPEETTRVLLDRLTVNAERLRELLDDFVDVSQLAAESLDMLGDRVDLADLAPQVVERLDLPDTHAIDFRLQPAPTRIEISKFGRLAAHLLTNATKHTPPGTRIWVETETTSDGVLFTVSDDGPGIPDDRKEAVFAPFVQGAETINYPSPGTGMGLTLVAKLAELQGGRAWVADRPGGGAAFHVLLPTVDVQEDGDGA